MTKQKFLVIVLFINVALLLFNSFYTHDKVAIIINLITCFTSWLAINVLDQVEQIQTNNKNNKNNPGEDNVDKQ